jgi:hypothetical protein
MEAGRRLGVPMIRTARNQIASQSQSFVLREHTAPKATYGALMAQ